MRVFVGDIIEHACMGNVYQGKVVSILSAQFVYETDEGHTRICLFKSDWKMVKKKRRKVDMSKYR